MNVGDSDQTIDLTPGADRRRPLRRHDRRRLQGLLHTTDRTPHRRRHRHTAPTSTRPRSAEGQPADPGSPPAPKATGNTDSCDPAANTAPQTLEHDRRRRKLRRRRDRRRRRSRLRQRHDLLPLPRAARRHPRTASRTPPTSTSPARRGPALRRHPGVDPQPAPLPLAPPLPAPASAPSPTRRSSPSIDSAVHPTATSTSSTSTANAIVEYKFDSSGNLDNELAANTASSPLTRLLRQQIDWHRRRSLTATSMSRSAMATVDEFTPDRQPRSADRSASCEHRWHCRRLRRAMSTSPAASADYASSKFSSSGNELGHGHRPASRRPVLRSTPPTATSTSTIEGNDVERYSFNGSGRSRLSTKVIASELSRRRRAWLSTPRPRRLRRRGQPGHRVRLRRRTKSASRSARGSSAARSASPPTPPANVYARNPGHSQRRRVRPLRSAPEPEHRQPAGDRYRQRLRNPPTPPTSRSPRAATSPSSPRPCR